VSDETRLQEIRDACVRWMSEPDEPGVVETLPASPADVLWLLSLVKRLQRGCEFGCGLDDGEQYVGGPGVSLVPACPVHGWVCELLDAREAALAEAREALQKVDGLAAHLDRVGIGYIHERGVAIRKLARAALAAAGETAPSDEEVMPVTLPDAKISHPFSSVRDAAVPTVTPVTIGSDLPTGAASSSGAAAAGEAPAARPVEKFLRLAGWSEERIAEVVAAHEGGESYEVSVTLGGEAPAARERE